jgi:dTDP-4-amino-4,6-dideoxygalactose transaminase
VEWVYTSKKVKYFDFGTIMKIPLTLPKFADEEISAVMQLLNTPQDILSEKNSRLCKDYLTQYYQAETLVTHSCTGALEMSALLLDIKPQDEVIIPSYTFVSTATAFVLFGAKPVFVDIKQDSLNLDPELLESAITSRTKAIVVVHYAGIACDMAAIQKIAQKHGLVIIEDAAQCIAAKYRGQNLGTFGSLAALSFHNTKNVTAGLGGALIVNDPSFNDRAKIIWQKGTNREAFIEGQVDKYTWQDLGSSYMINELGAALLYAQLNRLEEITKQRLSAWNTYQEDLRFLEQNHGFQRPRVPEDCTHNGHIYYLIAPSVDEAVDFRSFLASQGISAQSHFVPLHLAPAGQRFSGKRTLPVCESLYRRIIRLPLWEGVSNSQNYVIETISEWSKNR